MNEITDFRNGKKTEVFVNKKWFSLLSFSNGTFGIKFNHIKKPFNPYHVFDNKNTEIINNYLKN